MEERASMRSPILKRALDVAGSLFALVVLAVPLLLVALGVRIFMGSPVTFRQRRPGLGGAPFEIYKFRTMRDATDEAGAPLPDEKRLTAFGRFLRRTSLDELPELFNILRGDMSFVGPRPLLMEYLPRYSKEQARRHDVKPGLTGWAQVHGRNTVSWEERFALDVWYVDHWNLWLDAKILCLTPLQIFRTNEVSAAGHATMPKFTGTAEEQ